MVFKHKYMKNITSVIITIFIVLLISNIASSFGNTTLISNKEIDDLMVTMNVKKYNTVGLKINYDTYRRYHFFVYGNPYGTYSLGYSGEMEYRYLGYDYNGYKFTNDMFPNDATASDPRDRRYVKMNGARESWDKKVTTSSMETLMLKTNPIDDGIQLDYSLYDIFKGRCRTVDEMKDYIFVNYPATIITNGSVTTTHIN